MFGYLSHRAANRHKPTSVAFMYKEDSMRWFDGCISSSTGTYSLFWSIDQGHSNIPGKFPGQLVAPLLMHPQTMAQQARRHYARQVCIAGLPPTANEQSVANFFRQVMAAIGGNSSGQGDAVVNVDINHEKKLAVVEMRSVEEASNAMALNGVNFEGSPLVVGRPSDYDHFISAALGPCHPNPNLNLAAVGLTPHSAHALGGSDSIFVGGIPDHLTLAQIRLLRQLLESFGTLRCFDLVTYKKRWNSKVHAFCAYQDPSVTDDACLFFNDLKTLIVKRAYPCGSRHLREGSDCIFVGVLPWYFTEARIREVLETFGPLRCFHLLIDTDTGNSKGHFCVYQDPSVTDSVCKAFNGIKMGDHTLVVRREYQDGSLHTLEQENIQAAAAGSE